MHSPFDFLNPWRLRFLLVFLSAMMLYPTRPASATTGDTTAIVILGTVHARTDRFTVETLQAIMRRVKPDLILVELDSSFLTPTMAIKPEFKNISLENAAVSAYQEANGVSIRPYDIEGRNNIYKQHNYFAQQQEFSRALGKADEDSLLRGESALLLDVIVHFDNIGRAFGSEAPEVINSDACDAAMESKQYYAGDGMVKIATLVPALKQFGDFAKFKRDFWITRNEAMVTHILEWTRLLHPKRLLVICGFEHRYYLLKDLKTYRTRGAFILREYWTF